MFEPGQYKVIEKLEAIGIVLGERADGHREIVDVSNFLHRHKHYPTTFRVAEVGEAIIEHCDDREEGL